MPTNASATDANTAEFGASCDTDHAVFAVTLTLVLILTISMKMTEGMQLPVSLGSAWIGALAGLVFAEKLLLVISMGRKSVVLVVHEMMTAFQAALAVDLVASVGAVWL
ncbi:hypothetical protein PsorP6_011537 [Peronosclerospora sorghi]|uniref:Uncharacterized protein n=1 Tax=Peronosclerospora sorghi TaxID=230839 RepID=A0ACC0WHL4_9STRA|nr:hypothetical protein PsorP6_011537 [Peronosclerospora sorghi]